MSVKVCVGVCLFVLGVCVCVSDCVRVQNTVKMTLNEWNFVFKKYAKGMKLENWQRKTDEK